MSYSMDDLPKPPLKLVYGSVIIHALKPTNFVNDKGLRFANPVRSAFVHVHIYSNLKPVCRCWLPFKIQMHVSLTSGSPFAGMD